MSYILQANQPSTKVQLDYNETTDLTTSSGTVLTINTWTDLCPNKSFTVDNAASVVEIAVGGAAQLGAVPSNMASCLVIDSGGTTITKPLGGGSPNPNPSYPNPLEGAGTVALLPGTLLPGTHTVKIQVFTDAASERIYCACASQPNIYSLYIRVLEHYTLPAIASGPSATTKVQLDYALASDVTGLSCPNTTWTDVIANQTFTVDDPNSVIEVSANGFISLGNAGPFNAASRVIVDSAGTPVTKMLGGCELIGAGQYFNVLGGANLITITGLAAGNHTVKVQVYPNGGSATLYCRPVGNVVESLQIRVLERKQTPTANTTTALSPSTKVQFNAGLTAVASPLAVSTNVWTYATTSVTFSVDNANSVVEFSFAGSNMEVGPLTTADSSLLCRLVLDGNTTTTYQIGYTHHNGYAGFENAMLGSGTTPITGLSVGTHTARVQFISDNQSVNVYPQMVMSVIERYNIPSNVSGPQPTTKAQLNYDTGNTVIWNGTSLAVTTWYDVFADQTFTIDDPNSVVEIVVGGAMTARPNSVSQMTVALLLDDTTQYYVGMDYASGSGSVYCNPFAGCSPIVLTGLAAGTHRARVQINSGNDAWTAYLRGGNEHVKLQVLERKQSAALVSNCMVKLDEKVLTSAQPSIDFTGISQAYRDLELRITGQSDASTTDVNVNMTFNGDTGANYDGLRAVTFNSGARADGAGSFAATSLTVADISAATAPASSPGSYKATISDYARTAWYKVMNSYGYYRYATSSSQIDQFSGAWHSTAAITSIHLVPSSGNFAQGSVASLYGIL